MISFSDFEEKWGEQFVCEDGSAGYISDGVARYIMRPFVPSTVGWNDWPHKRREDDEPAVMRVKDRETVKKVRAEIARRWTDLMETYIKYDT